MRLEETSSTVEPEVEPPTLVQPREHRAKVSIWADLTVSDMDIIDDAVTPEDVKTELAHIFGIENFKENLKDGILVDLYYYTIQFCRDCQFSKEQTSALFSIVKQTHQVCIETPFGNVEQTFNYFRELILCHAVKRPPFSIDLFTPEQVRKITEYVINTYFRHIKMYKYAFTPLVRLDLSMEYIGLPPTPEPSEVGDLGDPNEAEAEQQDGDAETTGQEEDKPAEEEDSPAARELRKLIKQHLSEEMNKLKADVEQQMKESEDTLNQKLASSEPTKGGKNSAKGKKK